MSYPWLVMSCDLSESSVASIILALAEWLKRCIRDDETNDECCGPARATNTVSSDTDSPPRRLVDHQLNLPTESLLLNSSSVLLLGTGHLPSLPPSILLHASVRLCASWLLCAIHVASQAKHPANDQSLRPEHTLSCASRAAMLATSAERWASQVFSAYQKVEFGTCPPPSSFLLTVSKEPFLLYR